MRSNVLKCIGIARSALRNSTAMAASSMPMVKLSPIGSIAGDGLSNELADPDNDGEANALEFTTAQDPAVATRAGVTSVVNGASTEFTYKRSKAAKNGGTAFQVEYTDNLPGGVWSTSGINQEPAPILDDGTAQTMKILVPFATGRMVRLKITLPGEQPVYASAASASRGTLQLLAANLSHTGGSNLNAGTILVSHADALARSTANMNGGALSFSATNPSPGSLQSTATNRNIALKDTSASPLPVTLAVGAGGASTTCMGTLSGSGSFAKVGAGTLTPTAPQPFTGSTSVNEGTLALGGNLTGRLNVTGGAFAPQGMPAVAGSVTFGAGGTLRVRSNAAGIWTFATDSDMILSDDGTLQQVKVTVPAGPGPKRFVRLKVTKP